MTTIKEKIEELIKEYETSKNWSEKNNNNQANTIYKYILKDLYDLKENYLKPTQIKTSNFKDNEIYEFLKKEHVLDLNIKANGRDWGLNFVRKDRDY